MRELHTVPDLDEAAENDGLLLWAAQGLAPGVRAWAQQDAVAVASPGLSGRDRLAVRGPAGPAARLVRHALAEFGPSLRPVGDSALIDDLVTAVPGLRRASPFRWMELRAAGPADPDASGVPPLARLLSTTELPEAAALLDEVFPGSYAHPLLPGSRSWAGVRDETGRLTALAADAWSAPEVGFLAGVAAHPVHGRGRGHAAAACRLLLDTMLRRCGRAALMVDEDNPAAIRLYERLGMHRRDLHAAFLDPA
ncbi:GNAT family N-acetyltransferase [Kitasatospora mediocidica]|uniref:GNAT family N-acetyltransferase n=1 Tax=Kitasatospora mediocidica TaxID=58352 RepID=UPI000563EB3E|nr:GNAT family N-acetyltransferase [Kitasatospora mediocidica]